jgi:hypothetical protein
MGAMLQLRRHLKHSATVDKTKTDGSTPLCKAAGNNHTNAMQLLLRRTAAVDTVASPPAHPPPATPHRSIVECSGSSPVFDRERFGAYAIWLGDHFKWYKEQAGEWISMCSSAAAGVASVGGRD